MVDRIPEDLQQRAASAKPSTNGHAPNLSGAEVLGGLVAFIRRFVALSDEQADMAALWVFHTHAIDAADCTDNRRAERGPPRRSSAFPSTRSAGALGCTSASASVLPRAPLRSRGLVPMVTGTTGTRNPPPVREGTVCVCTRWCRIRFAPSLKQLEPLQREGV